MRLGEKQRERKGKVFFSLQRTISKTQARASDGGRVLKMELLGRGCGATGVEKGRRKRK